MIISIIHRLIEPCACAFLFGHCTMPSLAQGTRDSLILLLANLPLQLHLIQWQEYVLALLFWQGSWRPPLSLFPWANGALWEGEPLGMQRKGDFQRESFQEFVRSHDFSPQIYSWGHFYQHLSSVRSLCLQLAQVLYFHHGVMLMVSAFRKMLLFHHDLGQVLELCYSISTCH